MELIVVETHDLLASTAADLICASIAVECDAPTVVPTGNTPVATYAELAKRRSEGLFDASRLRVFQLDDYLGISEDDPRSLYGWMRRSFLEPLGVPDEHVVRLRGDTADPDAVCREYDARVRLCGGLGLSILGLGVNGHLGFNEPPADPRSPTRVVRLAPVSLESNSRYWGGMERVPREALTAGMSVLLAARRTLLLVAGADKRDVLWQAMRGPITPEIPASYLQRAPSVTVIADREAAPRLGSRGGVG